MHSKTPLSGLITAKKKLPRSFALSCTSPCASGQPCTRTEARVPRSDEDGLLRIAVLDGVSRTRERVRRAILTLGQVSVTFANVAELRRAYSLDPRCFEILWVACPSDDDASRRLTDEVRWALERRVPLIFGTTQSRLLETSVLEAGIDDEVVLTPPTLEDACSTLKSYLKRRNLQAARQS